MSATPAYIFDHYKTGCHWESGVGTLDTLEFHVALLSLRYGLSKDNVMCSQYGLKYKCIRPEGNIILTPKLKVISVHPIPQTSLTTQ